MNSYGTPRRQASLFERMQSQIQKISKKLSAAKQCYAGSVAKTRKAHFSSYNSIEDKNQKTTRRTRYPEEHSSPQTGFRNRKVQPNFFNPPEKKVEEHSYNKIILKLQDENSRLSYRLGKVQEICQTQSHRIGYMKGQLRQTSRQLSSQKDKLFKQTTYLQTLLEHYKNKSKKYKKMLKQNSCVSIDLGTESNI